MKRFLRLTFAVCRFTLEACREELQEVLEEWIIIGLKTGTPIPPIDGIEIPVEKEASVHIIKS